MNMFNSEFSSDNISLIYSTRLLHFHLSSDLIVFLSYLSCSFQILESDQNGEKNAACC